jgi:hypothetical protein
MRRPEFSLPANFRVRCLHSAENPRLVKVTVFWDIPHCSLLEVSRGFGRTYSLHPQDRRRNKAKTSPKAGDFQRSIQRYIPEDRTLHSYRCGNLYSKKSSSLLPVSPISLMCNHDDGSSIFLRNFSIQREIPEDSNLQEEYCILVCVAV